jgi:hypothetical protein
VRVFSTLLLATIAALGVYAIRKRLLFALKVGAGLFLVLLPIRLLLAATQLHESLDALIWPVCALLAVWFVLRWVSLEYERRKRTR